MRRALLGWALPLLVLAGRASAQPRVVVTDAGPGPSGRILSEALRAPHRLVEPDSVRFVLRRNEHERVSLIVLGRTAVVEGIVEGNVTVVGGDLFVHPGARITGRAVAIGGGAYPSALAIVSQGTRSFRDNTFSITRDSAGYSLAYQSLYADAGSSLLLPGVLGLRFPTYDRVNGASIPFGPVLTLAGGRGEVEAIAAYRSDLGKVDPAVAGAFQATRRFRVVARAERGTFSNDAWIRSDFVNSLTALASGTDTRNYYRADRAEIAAHRLWEGATLQIEPAIGLRAERSRPVGPAVGERRGPWSIFGRTDTLEGMWRPNPPVSRLDMYSALGGTTVRWEAGGVRLRGRTLAERSLDASTPSGPAPASFTQLTSDMDVTFLTFGDQEYRGEIHWVTSLGGTVPLQRFVYLGGSGTMPFLDLLEQGGDELLFVDQRYSIPLPNIQLGFLGSPTLQFRHGLGSAGLGRLPTLEQTLGAGVHLTVIRGEIQLNPADGAVRFSVGFTFSR